MDDDVRASSADRYAVSQAHRWKAERDAARQELREIQARLMPEGMEWPSFYDGEPVQFMDDFVRNSEEHAVGSVTIYHDGSFALNFLAYSKGERVKRTDTRAYDPDGLEIRVGDELWLTEDGSEEYPDVCGEPLIVTGIQQVTGNVKCLDRKDRHMGSEDPWFIKPMHLTHKRPASKVLDADGVEIRVGDVLYSIETGDSVTVDSIEPGNPWFATTDGALQHCAKFTHRAPIFAADGLPLLDGDEVWRVEDGSGPYHVQEVRDGASVCVGETWREFRPDELTHERPVVDTWERLEEDATKLSPYYYARDVMGLDTDKMPPKESRRIDMMRDLVRRAKALAERDR